VKSLLITLIRLYKYFLSPLKSTKCPFFPTCSDYAISAVKEYGSIKGSLLAAFRIIRCNPFNKGYYDPPQNWGDKLKFKIITKKDL